MDCRFCGLIDSIEHDDVATHDTPLYADNDFVVVPSLGAVGVGHVLVVSREHVLCVGAADDVLRARLETLLDSLGRAMESRFGAVATFEHGPSSAGSAAGCGIDHLHVHLAPVDAQLDLAGAVATLEPGLDWTAVSHLDALRDVHDERMDYVMLRQSARGTLLASGQTIQSQLVRRALLPGQPDYRWADNPRDAEVTATVRACAGILAPKRVPAGVH